MFKFDQDGLLSKPTTPTTPSENKESISYPSNNKNKSTSSSRGGTVNNSYSSTTNTSFITPPPSEATNAVLGGDIGNALKEMSSVFATPFNAIKDRMKAKKEERNANLFSTTLRDVKKYVKKVPNPIGKKRGRGKDKKPRKTRVPIEERREKKNTVDNWKKSIRESEQTNKLLQDIAKSGGGNSKKSLNPFKGKIGGLGKAMTLRGITKGLGLLGAVVGAVSGMKDYREIMGLGDTATTLSQKMVAGVGGIINGLNETVKFFTGGKVDLIDKKFLFKKLEQIRVLTVNALDSVLGDHPQLKKLVSGIGDGLNKVFNVAGDALQELYTSLTTENMSMPTMNKIFKHIGSMYDSIAMSIKDLSDRVNNYVNEKINAMKRTLGIDTKAESTYRDARDKRQAKQDEIDDGRNTFESYTDYQARLKKLNAELVELKKDEVKKAKESLQDADFKNKSKLRYEAQQALLIEEQEAYKEKNKAFIKHSKERIRLEKILENDLSMIDKMTKLLGETTDKKQIDILQKSIKAYGISYANTQKDLKALQRVEPKRVSTISASTSSIGKNGVGVGDKALLDRIRVGEGSDNKKASRKGYKSGYDVTLGYGKFADDKAKPITQMTIKEVYAHQKKMKKNKKNRFATGRKDKNGKMIKLPSSAVGAFQIIEPTLRRLVKKLGIKDDEKFDEAMQDKLALQLIKEQGGEKYKRGNMSDGKFQDKLANIWASVATTKGKSAYGQHTGTSSSQIQRAMTEYKNDVAGKKSAKSEKIKPLSPTSQTPTINIQDNRDLLEKLVKNTTPKADQPKQRDVSINHVSDVNSI